MRSLTRFFVQAVAAGVIAGALVLLLDRPSPPPQTASEPTIHRERWQVSYQNPGAEAGLNPLSGNLRSAEKLLKQWVIE